MEFFEKNKTPILWFISGLGFGLTLLSISHAGLPSRSSQGTVPMNTQGKTLLREIKGGKISSPEFEAELAELNRLEGRYVESSDQMERLKGRGIRASGAAARAKRKGLRK